MKKLSVLILILIFLSACTKQTTLQIDSRNFPSPSPINVNDYQSLIVPEEELITLLFGLINNHQNNEAIKLLSPTLNPDENSQMLWLEQFNSIKSVHILEMKETAKDTWTDTSKIYKVTLEIYIDNSSSTSISNYGWQDNPNIRFITVWRGTDNKWYIDQIGTRF